MGEDKLTHAQRLRLEAFAQAHQSLNPMGPRPDLEVLFKRAEQIEAWLKAAAIERTPPPPQPPFSLPKHRT